MSESKRAVAIKVFGDALPAFKELGGKAFRNQVTARIVQLTGCTHSAACTHYNYAFKKKFAVTNPELVEGLGRAPEKNNGGRKKKVAAPLLLLTYTPTVDPLTPDLGPVQEKFSVRVYKSDETVATDLTHAEALAMVQRAAKQKKSKLYWV